MDPVTAALSAAWLQAVSRIQSQPAVDPPQPEPPKTMTDVMERVLRNAAPDTPRLDRPGALLNRLV
jgi:hypothetical protein